MLPAKIEFYKEHKPMFAWVGASDFSRRQNQKIRAVPLDTFLGFTPDFKRNSLSFEDPW